MHDPKFLLFTVPLPIPVRAIPRRHRRPENHPRHRRKPARNRGLTACVVVNRGAPVTLRIRLCILNLRILDMHLKHAPATPPDDEPATVAVGFTHLNEDDE